MKVTNKVTSRNVVLGSALLGICTTIGFTNPAQAAPRDDNARQYRQDDRDDQDNNDAARDDKDGKPGARKGQRRGRDGNRGPRDQKQDGRYNRDDQQRDNRRGDDRQNGRGGGRGQGHDDGDYGKRGRQNDSYDFSNRGGNDTNRADSRRPAGNRGPSNDRFETNGGRGYTGTVTRVRSATSFDVNINGDTFNVYLDAPAPRALIQSDTVRINGVQQDKNDIRNASVSLLRNR